MRVGEWVAGGVAMRSGLSTPADGRGSRGAARLGRMLSGHRCSSGSLLSNQNDSVTYSSARPLAHLLQRLKDSVHLLINAVGDLVDEVDAVSRLPSLYARSLSAVHDGMAHVRPPIQFR